MRVKLKRDDKITSIKYIYIHLIIYNIRLLWTNSVNGIICDNISATLHVSQTIKNILITIGVCNLFRFGTTC